MQWLWLFLCLYSKFSSPLFQKFEICQLRKINNSKYFPWRRNKFFNYPEVHFAFWKVLLFNFSAGMCASLLYFDTACVLNKIDIYITIPFQMYLYTICTLIKDVFVRIFYKVHIFVYHFSILKWTMYSFWYVVCDLTLAVLKIKQIFWKSNWKLRRIILTG